MTPYYIPLVIGGAVTIMTLVFIFTPTECVVMYNHPKNFYPKSPPHILQPDVLEVHIDADGYAINTKKVVSSLEESEIITVHNPPNNVLDAVLFWIDTGGIIVMESRESQSSHYNRSHHVECNDMISQAIQWAFPSMFPKSE